MRPALARRAVLGLAAALLALAPGHGRAQLFQAPDWYTLADAAAANKTSQVAYLLGQGQSPNFIDPHGRTPLDYAATFGNVAMIKLLLDGGARVDYRDAFGSTALHWAAERGNVDAVEVLIAAKAPLDAQNREGVTPLMLAASTDEAGAVRALLKAGADPRKQDFTGRDAFGWARSQPTIVRLLKDPKS